ncbi:hypothetical protein VCHA36O157_100023 [Vibrio chagasii]|nr:hypothetical protein VCHA36O157_100023 [Vibrio chagasii]CAH6797664.1 hypothetical protein VCHA34P115_100165 [Vibrio chagasii]CAH7178389.1 hypothetical protein VCHA57P511_120129 [Vibrio chagasii]CAH7408960.1 hypothetical protein VCHA43O270_70168 [Vibrio chagasii]
MIFIIKLGHSITPRADKVISASANIFSKPPLSICFKFLKPDHPIILTLFFVQKKINTKNETLKTENEYNMTQIL